MNRLCKKRSATTSCGFRGGLDEVRLWKGQRSDSQLRETIKERLSGVEANLTGYWPLDDVGGTLVVDLVRPDCAHDPGGAASFAQYSSPFWTADMAAVTPAGACSYRQPHHAGLVGAERMRWLRSPGEARAAEHPQQSLRLVHGSGPRLDLTASDCADLSGFATPDELVTAHFAGRVYRTVAEAGDGAWRICLATAALSGGPLQLLVESGSESVAIDRVYVGSARGAVAHPSNCHNDGRHSVDAPLGCEATAYPRRFLRNALMYWPFDGCSTIPQGNAPSPSRATGRCRDGGGYIGSGWSFGPGQVRGGCG
jgi:hypothetical protein